jgi:hypothetical protein
MRQMKPSIFNNLCRETVSIRFPKLIDGSDINDDGISSNILVRASSETASNRVCQNWARPEL